MDVLTIALAKKIAGIAEALDEINPSPTLSPVYEEGSIDANGVDIASTAKLRTVGYLQINSGTTYRFSLINGNGVIIRLYDENKNYLSSKSVTATETSASGNFSFSDVEGAAYFRIVINTYSGSYTAAAENLTIVAKRPDMNNFTDAEKAKLAGIEAGAEANVIETVRLNGTALTPDADKTVNITLAISDVTDIYNGIQDSAFGTAIVLKPAFERGSINAEGADTDAAMLMRTVGFIKIEQGRRYRFSLTEGHGAVIRLYNSSKVYLSSESVTTGGTGTFVFSETQNAAYFRVVINAASGADAAEADDLTLTVIKDEGVLSGKKIVFLGDSYTYPDEAYHYYLAQKTNCTALNYGVSSSRICLDVTVNNNVIKSFLTRFSELSNELGQNIDGMCILGGINDANSIRTGDLTLGNLSDSAGDSTFFGGLKQLCENIINTYPTKRLLAIIPPDLQSGAAPAEWRSALASVQDAEEKVYSQYGIPYVSLKKECFEMGTLSALIPIYRMAADNIHPSRPAGQVAIANCIEARFREIFIKANVTE